MVKNTRYKNWILYAILAVHIIWLIIHCSLSYQGWINQWKMTGYGMYTGPSPNLYSQVYLGNGENIATTSINLLNDQDYRKVNYYFGLYCLQTNAEKINILINDNPELIGKDFYIVVSGRFMRKNPITTVYEDVSRTQIEWTSEETYQYTSQIPKCDGKTYSGQGKFVAED